MTQARLSKLEYQIMNVLWDRGECSIRDIQEAFPERKRPAYTTVQTTVYRMEAKDVVRRVRKVGNFHIFAATITRSTAQRRLIDDLLALFGGRTQPVMAHLIESGRLTLEDVREAERALERLQNPDTLVTPDDPANPQGPASPEGKEKP
jgi:predicted transcriptional regulator